MIKPLYIAVSLALVALCQSASYAAERNDSLVDGFDNDPYEAELIQARNLKLRMDTQLMDAAELEAENRLVLREASTNAKEQPVIEDLQLSFARALDSSAYIADEYSSSENSLAENGVQIDSDNLQIYLDRTLTATGNAVLTKQDQQIFGDTIEYDMINEELSGNGHTRIKTPSSLIRGTKFKIRLSDSVGEMTAPEFSFLNAVSSSSPRPSAAPKAPYNKANTPLTSRNIEDGDARDLDNSEALSSFSAQSTAASGRGDAKMLFFDGEDKKRLKNARYTTCAADSNDWYIKASEIKLNDYTRSGEAKNAVVEFKGVPILYSPFINFSLDNQRKSGLLAPTFGTTSRSGFEFLQPYYWNIAPNMDATLAARALSKRGIQLQGEYRYLTDHYSGEDNLEYLAKDSTSDRERHYIKLTHRHYFGGGWSGGFNIENVSDDKYFSELSTRIVSTSRVNLPQQADISYSGNIWQFNGLVQKFQTLDGASYPYERLPQLTLTGEKDWGNVSGNIITQFVSFDRDPQQPIAISTLNGGTLTTAVKGNRFVAYPSISFPLTSSYGYITSKFGIHHTDYHLKNTAFTVNDTNTVSSGHYSSGSRNVPIFSLDSGLFFDRDTRVVNRQYLQTLEPRMFYVYAPYRNQSLFPIFDSAESDLNLGSLFIENQFTGNDRINDANQLSLALTTRLIDKASGEQRLAATIGQRYYFSDQRVGLPATILRTDNSSDIIGAVTAKLRNGWDVDTAWQYNTYRDKMVRANIGTRYNPAPGKTLNLSYRYFENRLEQVNLSGQWPIAPKWYGVGRWNYSIQEKRPIEGLAGLEYDAGCWQARGVLQRVSTATANANYALFFQLELGGLASIGFNPLNLLKRSIPGYADKGLTPNTYEQQPYE